MATPGDPVILCYDGSDDAKRAIEHAGRLFTARPALVLTVWQPTATLGSFAWAGEVAAMVDFVELDRAAAQDGERLAAEGLQIARDSGLQVEPVVVPATTTIWKAIVEIADDRQAAAIVVGSRGLTGLRSMMLGSVSGAVVAHAHQPVVVIRHDDHPAGV